MKTLWIERLILGASLLMPLATVWAQAATVTQHYLGAPVPNPVVAVELDAAPGRLAPSMSGQPAGTMDSSAGGYAARIQSQTSPATYTGAGGAARNVWGLPPGTPSKSATPAR